MSWWEVQPPTLGYFAVLPALVLAGLMPAPSVSSRRSCASSRFCGSDEFRDFPDVLASTALYPLWRLEEASNTLALLASLNPFTYAVELIRFALYLKLNLAPLAVVIIALVAFFSLAVPRGFWARRLES